MYFRSSVDNTGIEAKALLKSSLKLSPSLVFIINRSFAVACIFIAGSAVGRVVSVIRMNFVAFNNDRTTGRSWFGYKRRFGGSIASVTARISYKLKIYVYYYFYTIIVHNRLLYNINICKILYLLIVLDLIAYLKSLQLCKLLLAFQACKHSWGRSSGVADDVGDAGFRSRPQYPAHRDEVGYAGVDREHVDLLSVVT